jgi:hypothetical protein
LEARCLLAAFDLTQYEFHFGDDDLPNRPAVANFSGVAYHPPTQSFIIPDNQQNANNGSLHEYRYGFAGTTWTMLHRQVAIGDPPTLTPRVVNMAGFDLGGGDPREGDPEGIVWKGGQEFTFVREQMGIFHNFFLDVDGTYDADTLVDGDVTGPFGAPDGVTDTITNGSPSITASTTAPNPTLEGLGDTNDGLEGIAYDPVANLFYAVKEFNWANMETEIIYEITPGVPNAVTAPLAITTLGTEALSEVLEDRDASDIFYAAGHLFVLTEAGGTDRISRVTLAGSAWTYDNTNPNSNLVLNNPPGFTIANSEGLAFSPDGLDMFVVGEDARFYHYRNFTGYTFVPANIPDMRDTDDTGISNTDGISSTLRPQFTGTVPEGSYVRLYVDGGFVGHQNLANGATAYSIQPGADLSPGPHAVTIRLAEDATSPAINWSADSPPLNITIDTTVPTVTVSNRTTNDTTPSLTGTITDNLFGPASTIQVTVNGQNYNATNNGNGTWSLADNTITPALGSGTYSVTVTATDPAGNVGTDATSNELFIDLTNPSVTAKTPENTTRITATVDIDVTFSEPVMGLDATDLALTGSATGPHAITVDPPVNVGGNTWRFRVRKLRTGAVNVTPNTAGITDVAGNPLMAVNWSFSTVVGDLNGDGETDRKDGALLAPNFGTTTGATAAQGDLDLDGRIGADDLFHYQVNLATGGEGLMGGGSGGGESTGGGGEGSGGEGTSGGESGGGESLLDSTPARIYFTTSASTSGGGVLGSSVPAITLPSPGESVDLYVWVNFGSYQKMISWGLDVTATNPNVVKATATEVYNPVIWDTEYEEEYGSRWNPSGILASALNPNGVGATALAMNSKAVGIGGGEDLRDHHDGAAGHPLLDMLYDPVADAFLVQRVRLEALPGSAGLSTGIVMWTGSVGIVIDTTTATQGLPIYLCLGTTSISTHQLGATDGSTHATITVSAGSPGAVFSTAVSPATSRIHSRDTLSTQVARAHRTADRSTEQPQAPEPTTPNRPPSSFRASRHALDSRAADRLFGL